MKNINIISFEEGIERLVKSGLKHKNKPFLAGIFGNPHSGKTELNKRVRDKLYELGKFGWIGMNRASLDRYPGEKKDIEYYLIEDIGMPICAERYAIKHFEKGLDLKIYMIQTFSLEAVSIFDRKNVIDGIYDFIIENPKASSKGKYVS